MHRTFAMHSSNGGGNYKVGVDVERFIDGGDTTVRKIIMQKWEYKIEENASESEIE